MKNTTKNTTMTVAAALMMAWGMGSLNAAPVTVETVTHRVEVPMSHSNWSAALEIPQFDGAIGTLTAVEVRLSGVGSTVTKLENRGNLARDFVTGADTTIQLLGPDGAEWLKVQPSIRTSNRLPRFDGKLDCAGTSGVCNAEKQASGATSVVLDGTVVDLSGFVGTGVIGFGGKAEARGFYRGSASYSFSVETKASMAVEVVYSYVPAVVVADEALGTIESRVWKDKDGDGRQEQNENGLKGWLVELVRGGEVLVSVETGKDGIYGFTDVPAGVYTVRVTAKKGYRATYDVDGIRTAGSAVVEVVAGGVLTGVDFGFVKNSGTDNNDRDEDCDDEDEDDRDEDCDDDKGGKGKDRD